MQAAKSIAARGKTRQQRGERKALESVFPFIGQRFREESAKARLDPQVRLSFWIRHMLEGVGSTLRSARLCNSSRQLRLRRLAEQRGWTEPEVEAREKAQMPLEEKRRRADAVIDNSGTPEEAAAQVEGLLRKWELIS